MMTMLGNGAPATISSATAIYETRRFAPVNIRCRQCHHLPTPPPPTARQLRSSPTTRCDDNILHHYHRTPSPAATGTQSVNKALRAPDPAVPTPYAATGTVSGLPCHPNSLQLLCWILMGKMEGSHMAVRRATSLPILLNHGRVDEFVSYRNGERSIEFLRFSGFSYVSFKSYNGLGHYTILKEMDDACKWLSSRLSIDQSW
ncbi:hypothetical protein ZWY2020_042083 [Hordeum vulgare]|nr:hypothetical protein ZWY2020_042083 [Hordeum vulgare]